MRELPHKATRWCTGYNPCIPLESDCGTILWVVVVQAVPRKDLCGVSGQV